MADRMECTTKTLPMAYIGLLLGVIKEKRILGTNS